MACFFFSSFSDSARLSSPHASLSLPPSFLWYRPADGDLRQASFFFLLLFFFPFLEHEIPHGIAFFSSPFFPPFPLSYSGIDGDIWRAGRSLFPFSPPLRCSHSFFFFSFIPATEGTARLDHLRFFFFLPAMRSFLLPLSSLLQQYQVNEAI